MKNMEEREEPMAPKEVKADEQPDCCGVDGWEPSEDPHQNRFEGTTQCEDEACEDCSKHCQ